MNLPLTTPSSLGIRLVAALLLLAAGLLPANGHADQQILDDLIVNGSACIGTDCVNGESFDFDTLRLKENNVRIKLQDTSTTGAFPKKDWELRANSRNNFGEEYFGIVDMDDLSQTCIGGNNDGADCTSDVNACAGSCLDGPNVGASCSADQGCGTPTCVGGTNDGGFCGGDAQCGGGACIAPYTCGGIGTCSEPGAVIFRVGGDAPAESLTIDSAGVVSAPGGAVVSTGLEVVGNINVTGTVDGRDVSADGATLDGISSGISTNASNISANTTAIAGKADASAVAANTTAIGNNTTDVATNKTAIDTHVGDTSNPHNVTAAQLGITSGPGGDLQAGILEPSDFTKKGAPRTAEVTFSSPRTSPYVVVLGLVSKNSKLLGDATILEQRADGFTVGMPQTNMKKLVQLNWMVVTP